jgi:hypothetical protein
MTQPHTGAPAGGFEVPAASPAPHAAGSVQHAAGRCGIGVTSLRSRTTGPLRSPVVEVDGTAHAASWGRTVVPVMPGLHQVVVYVPSIFGRRLGSAETVVAAAPDQTAELEYCFPLWNFMAGSLGPPPQHHRGALSVVVFVAVMILVTCATLAVFAGMNQ